MNIEKLEAILEEMRNAEFSDLAQADAKIRGWAQRIGNAITEHLLGEVGVAVAQVVPALASDPGGHGWDEGGGSLPE